jgi:ribosomal protein L11 methyltransferase
MVRGCHGIFAKERAAPRALHAAREVFFMEWTDIRLTVARADAELAEAVATMIAEGGIYIEDYSDIEQQVEQIAHVDLIEQELLDKPRDIVIIHLYLEPSTPPAETLALIAARMEAAGIAYTVQTEGVEQQDWMNGWRKYYHPMEIGDRLAVVPSWQEYDTPRTKLILDPGLAFGTGGHETTWLCLEALDRLVQGGERMLDIGTGSGILAIAALKLGAAEAEGVDIDPVAVRTAGENAALNGVGDRLRVLVGDLSAQASGTYQLITANIVANAIISLAPAVPALLAEGGKFIASGIIDTRKDEVAAALRAAGLRVDEICEKRGWECMICSKA